MASLKQIADELGVSFALVSKVLSGRMGTSGVSATTRERILKKARELDYRPNHLAVALQSGRKGSIAVFLHKMGTPGSEISSRFLDGLSASASEANLRLWLRFFESDQEFRSIGGPRLKREVDGLIIAGPPHSRLLMDIDRLEKEGLPVVSVFHAKPDPALPTNISVDYRAQGFLTTQHLIERGKTRIAHFRALELRYQGYIDAHYEAGIPVWPRLIQTTGLFFESGIEATTALLASGEPFDAINCQSDAQALGAIRVLRAHGRSVPDDVMVTGVDNSPLAISCEVPLTSASSEMEACGKLTMETLRKKIAGEPVSPMVLKPRLVLRDSTGK